MGVPIKFSEITSYTCSLHTDAVEFSPCGNQALVGSYELKEATGERFGQLIKFEIRGKEVEKSFTLTTPGILDLCWINADLCLSSTSSGEIYIIRSSPHTLTTEKIMSVSQESLLSTDSNNSKVVTADKAGNIYICCLENGVIDSWKAHEFEPWCVRFHRNDNNLILSGGDDCVARVWDQRVGFSRCVSSRGHSMGVCSLSDVPRHRHLISTGCFDEKVRVWDLRRSCGVGEPDVLCQSPGGGVWRHKWSPNGDKLLMACMHAGFAVVRMPSDFDAVPSGRVVSTPAFYRPSAKLAYGIAWRIDAYTTEQGFEALLATCSFYDNCVSFAICTDSV